MPEKIASAAAPEYEVVADPRKVVAELKQRFGLKVAAEVVPLEEEVWEREA
jgi:ribose 5-phosphate isomerase